MTITYDKQVLIKRGNTASVGSYVGPLGELVLDTDTNRVYVHDGATVGGTLVGDGTYGNANVAAYISTDATIVALVANAGVQSANIATLTANAAAQAGLLASLESNAAVQSEQISQVQTNITTANTNMKGYVDNSISANITAIINGAPGALDTLNELANALGNNSSFSTTITNSLATLTSNAAVQAGLIADTNTAIVTANLAMKGYVDSSISANIANVAQYSNSSVAAYLPTYNGNIKISNVTFSDLSVQRTAYTGQSWRTLLESNLQTKPTWLAYVPDGSKPTVDVNFGFDSGGMWFTGNANDQHAYPIRTNVNFYDTDATEIIATFDYDSIGDDHGIAIFNSATTQPFWVFGTNASRIAWQISTATPELRGQTTSSVAGAPVLEINNTYTIRMVYDPLAETNQVTVELYQGTGIAGTLLDTRTIDETLPAGAYEVGFDADQDNLSLKSYFTALTIRTLTNAVFNDIEVVNDLQIDGTVTGNLIPSANVTYDLGSPTAQWNDLYLSGSTIYLGGTALSIVDGGLTVGGNSAINFVSNSSGDGNGYTTIQLIPDNNLTANDQYLIIDPTEPTHIHIRAGGTQDNSNSALFLGGENSHVEVQAGENPPVYVRANNNEWMFDVDGNLTVPSSVIFADSTAFNGNTVSLTEGENFAFNLLAFVGGNYTPTQFSVYPTYIKLPTGNGSIKVGSEENNDTWALDSANKALSFPNNDIIRYNGDDYGLNLYTFSKPVVITAGQTTEWSFGNTGTLTAPGDITTSGNVSGINGTFTAAVTARNINADGGNISLNPDFGLIFTQSNAVITANTVSWTFSESGSLTFPDNTVQTTAWTGTGAITFSGNEIEGTTFGGTGTIITKTVDASGNDYSTGGGSLGFVNFTSGVENVKAGWTVTFASGVTRTVAFDAYQPIGTYWTIGFDSAYGWAPGDVMPLAITSPDYAAGTDPQVTLTAGTESWTFGNTGNITFPDTTIQTTAWTGNAATVDITDTNGLTTTYYPTFVENRTTGQIARADVNLTYHTDDNILGVGNIAIGGAGNITFSDSTVQATAWTGTVSYGNTIAIGYQTGITSQGNSAVAIGSTAGNNTQGIAAVALGEAAGRLSQGVESIAVGKTAGEQSQGAYAIAIGSATAYYQQGIGAVAIGTSAGALQQGDHAVAIGTGAGNGLQGNNSIILNATGNMLDQTTANTFTVAPIRNTTSSSGVLQYNNSTSEVTYANTVALASGTVEGFAIGYKEVPQVAAGNVTLALSDSGKHFYSTTDAPTTLTIPSNANVAFPIGTAISIVNSGTGNITIGKQAEASLYLAGNTTNTTRTLTSYGMATVLKTATNQWFISGSGLE